MCSATIGFVDIVLSSALECLGECGISCAVLIRFDLCIALLQQHRGWFSHRPEPCACPPWRRELKPWNFLRLPLR